MLTTSKALVLAFFLVSLSTGACGGGDDDGGNIDAATTSDGGTSDASPAVEACVRFCAQMNRCNAEDPGSWDSCTPTKAADCYDNATASASCLSALEAFATCAEAVACSEILTSCDAPVVFVLEGGYEMASLCDSVRITIEEMLKY